MNSEAEAVLAVMIGQARDLRADGLPFAKIGEALCVDTMTAYKWCQPGYEPKYITGPFESRLVERVVVPALGACLEYQGGRHPFGYGQLTAGGRKMYAHRHAYELANGPLVGRKKVLHHCDNPPCCNVEHLYLGTHQDNMRDMVERGRHHTFPSGDKHPHAKLTDAQIIWARERRAVGWLLRVLADELGVDESHMSRICRGELR